MVDVNDIVHTLKPPNKEKVSGTRSIFSLKILKKNKSDK